MKRSCDNPRHGLGCQCAVRKEKKEKVQGKPLTEEGKKVKELGGRLKQVEEEVAKEKKQNKMENKKKGLGEG